MLGGDSHLAEWLFILWEGMLLTVEDVEMM